MTDSMSLPAEVAFPMNNAFTESNEHQVLLKMVETPPQEPLIAVDLDDVLCETNKLIAEWHNREYGTNMTLSNFYYYYYWKNPFWGTPAETMRKVEKFYDTANWIENVRPTPGAKEGLQALKNMGYRLVVVTARDKQYADASWNWVEKHFPGFIDSLICTGQFSGSFKMGREVITRLSKAQVCADLGARLLIDDSAENAFQCATASPAVPALLFGDYEWNKRLSSSTDTRDEMTFDVRFTAEGGRKFWESERLEIPEGTPLWRVGNWGGVVEWVSDRSDPGPGSDEPTK